MQPIEVSVENSQESARWEQLVRGLLIAVSTALVLAVAGRTIVSWRHYGDLDATSGAWATVAVDFFDDGTLYRPLISNLGYGGTRYAPLQPVVLAGMMRMGMPVIEGGFLLTLICMGVVIAGEYVLMRRLGAEMLTAAIMAAFTLAASCFRMGIAKIHGDPLALALDLWGLIAVASLTKSDLRWRGWLILAAAVCFVLSFATKLTSVFGIAASLSWLLLRGRRRDGIPLVLAWGIGVIAVIAVTQAISHGRAIPMFRATATGGGGLRNLIEGPSRFFARLAKSDRETLGCWLAALATLLVSRNFKSLAALLFLITTAGTIVIFGSPGTSTNHFLSLQAASIIFLGVEIPAMRPTYRTWALAGLLLISCMGIISCFRQARTMGRDSHRTKFEEILADVNSSSIAGPIYCNDPLIPVLANQRPYIADGFMSTLLRQRNPASAAKLWDDIGQERFSACVVRTYPADSSALSWIEGPATQADEAAVEARVQARYYAKSVRYPYTVYLPKAR
jgi:hypothetical protein